MRQSILATAFFFAALSIVSAPSLATADALDDAKKMLFGTLKSLEKGGTTAACDTVSANTGRLADQMTVQALKSGNPTGALRKIADKAERRLLRNNPEYPQEAANCISSAKNIALKKIKVAVAKKAEAERKRKLAEAEAKRQAELAEKKRLEEARLRAEAEKKRLAEEKLKREAARRKAIAKRRAEAAQKKAEAEKEKAEAETRMAV
jgi:hypothetical protein